MGLLLPATIRRPAQAHRHRPTSAHPAGDCARCRASNGGQHRRQPASDPLAGQRQRQRQTGLRQAQEPAQGQWGCRYYCWGCWVGDTWTVSRGDLMARANFGSNSAEIRQSVRPRRLAPTLERTRAIDRKAYFSRRLLPMALVHSCWPNVQYPILSPQRLPIPPPGQSLYNTHL